MASGAQALLPSLEDFDDAADAILGHLWAGRGRKGSGLPDVLAHWDCRRRSLHPPGPGHPFGSPSPTRVLTRAWSKLKVLM